MLTRYPTADELNAMADTAERGETRFGQLSFMAMCLREEAERVRQGERVSGLQDEAV